MLPETAAKVAAVATATAALVTVTSVTSTDVSNDTGHTVDSAVIAMCRRKLAKQRNTSADGTDHPWVKKGEEIAADDSHGYDQRNRRLNPDVDCSSFVWYSLHQTGIDAGSAPFNTNSETTALASAGFEKHDYNQSEIKEGDILLRSGHTEIYIGNTKTVGAHPNEKGGITGGEPGDQTGHEVSVENLSGSWDSYFRYTKDTPAKTDQAADSRNEQTVAQSSSDMDHNGLYVAKRLASKGLSKAAVAGVLGNLQLESGINPKQAQIGGGGGFGMAQWTPRSKIRTWLDANGMSDVSDDDLEGQTSMLAAEITNISAWAGHNTEFNEWKTTDDPQTAATDFRAGYERAGVPNDELRRKYAKDWYDNKLGDMTFTGVASDGDKVESVADATLAECVLETSATSSDKSGDDDAKWGEVGGAPTDERRDFSWMCKAMQVCKAGDYGTFASGAYGYQCVWYAWTRLKMIHPGNWSMVMGNGGEIWKNVQSVSGWQADTTPHPGDGISGTSSPFAYGTHVAVVEEVKPDASGWKIRLSEGNMHHDAAAAPCYYGATDGCWVSYRGNRWFTKADLAGTDVHFFRRTDWK